jgi:hypothetical protein
VATKGHVILTATSQHGGLQTDFGGRNWMVHLPLTEQQAIDGEAEVVTGTPYRALRVQTARGRVLTMELQGVGCA